jgi:putative transposase
MPSKNIIKQYSEGTYYHAYNRGVEKRPIFIDDQDCHVFLRYIKLYLSSQQYILNLSEKELKTRRFVNLNMSSDVELHCFALMPNHFHLLIKNKTKNGIAKFMQRLITAYVMYFNKKYKRVGPLFQGVFKASTVDNDSYMMHLSRYVHNNSLKLSHEKINFQNYSSLQYYVGDRTAEWLKTEMIVSYFKDTFKPGNFKSSYASFVESNIDDSIALLDNLNLSLEDVCV